MVLVRLPRLTNGKLSSLRRVAVGLGEEMLEGYLVKAFGAVAEESQQLTAASMARKT